MTRPVQPLGPMDPSLGLPASGAVDAVDSGFSRLEQVRLGADARQARTAASTGRVDPKELASLRKASQDFESLFLSYIMKVGREATLKGGFMGHSQGEEIFTEMRDDELAKHMAHAGGIGLAKLLVEQLSRTLAAQARAKAQEGTPTSA